MLPTGETGNPSLPSPGPGDRLLLAPVAVRAVGADLLVARPGPWLDVERLTGSGPLLWHLLGEGLDLEDVVRSAARACGVTTDEVRRDVIAFVTDLVARGLAQRT